MTREKAKEIIKRAFSSWESEYRCSSEEDWSEEYEARDMAIEALEQEPCEDAISRQAVLDLCDMNNKYDIPYEYDKDNMHIRGYDEGRIINMSKLILLPLVTPQPKTEWIPVSERLPEESLNSVIGWDACRERCVFVQYWDGRFQITGKPESFDIKAWMPVPAPYKAESEDNNANNEDLGDYPNEIPNQFDNLTGSINL